MSMSKEDVGGKVVVVTGASSGNGKAMALLLARRGARLVLAARRAELLEATALEAESLGAEALAVPCDVTVREQVEAVAGAALERFGRIDAWINNAGVIAWSLFEDTTEEEFRRTLEVNLMGAVYGSWAALPAMRSQNSGVIVNIASMAALVALPVGSAYSSSKAGLFAFGDSLRRELRGSGIRVCQVLPVGVNTAGFFHQRTRGFRLSRRIAFLLQDPETVARAVLRCVERPGTRNVPLGLQGKAALAAGALAAGLVHQNGRTTSPQDNLFSPSLAGHDIRGEGPRSDYDPTPYLEEPPVPEAADADAAPLGQRLAALGCGRVLSDGSLQCPWHRARYDVRTGEMVSGPEGRVVGFEPYSKAVEAYANLTPLRLERYPVVEKDGVIYLRADVATGPPGEVGGGRRVPPPSNLLS